MNDKTNNDWMLTAYVLGELDDAERAEVEARLEHDEAARQYVEQARGLSDNLGQALREEASHAETLTDAQREHITQRAGAEPQRRFRIGVVIELAVAACVLIGVGLLLLPAGNRAREVSTVAMDQAQQRMARIEREADAASNRVSPDEMTGPAPTETAIVTPTAPTTMKSLARKEAPSQAYGLSTPALRESRRDSMDYVPGHNTEGYSHITDNRFFTVGEQPLSTFSIDVDTASYANLRRFLTSGQLPPADAVRIEEMINYFRYDDAPPTSGDAPFAAHTEVGACPWAPTHRLMRVALKADEVHHRERPAANLVFLLDVSGSMNSQDKLPLLKEGMKMLTQQLRGDDRVAIVVYAGASGLVLDSTPAENRQAIIDALDRLRAGGSTAGAAGIQLAYETAQRHFVRGGINRVILATDGDFNVGISSEGDLVRMIEQKRESDVFLSVLGFGTGNLKDSKMEQLADHGNGNYAYIDSAREAQKVLVEQVGSTLVTVAKDVKIQIEFNPARVAGYRLVGYENRVLAAQDFNDDKKDAGEIGAGHSVVALYEIVPIGVPVPAAKVDPLKYQTDRETTILRHTNELAELKLRYKRPDEDVSRLLRQPVRDGDEQLNPSADYRFAAAVAAFGMVLRDSPYKANASLAMAFELANQGRGEDVGGYRAEFAQLVRTAAQLKGQPLNDLTREDMRYQ